jgi:DUF4097 and DUF4098 domain-containing protein YvlB
MRIAHSAVVAAAILLITISASAQKKQEFHVPVSADSSISILNESGTINVRASSNNQLNVVATPHSDNVEVDQIKNATRVELRPHFANRSNPTDTRIDYEVQVPSNVNLILHSSSGTISVTGFNGDLICEGESTSIQVQDGGNGHVHIRTVDGPVSLTNVRNAHAEITSIGGDVTIASANGPAFNVNTTRGRIQYEGSFDGGGDYTFSTHSGNIDVIMPPNASVEVSARSVNGSVEDSYDLQPPSARPGVKIVQGKSFAGMANAGASDVKLRSFSGKITVKKK